MDWAATLGVTLGFVALAVFAGWRGQRPPNLVKGPRMVPWRLVMVLAASVVLLCLVHIANLLGFETGRR